MTFKNNKYWRSALGIAATGYISLNLGFNNTAGHQAIEEGALRLYFAPAWFATSVSSGKMLSFKNFKDNLYFNLLDYHDNNFDKTKRDMALLGGLSIFCLPNSEGNDNGNTPTAVSACHAIKEEEDEQDTMSPFKRRENV